MDSLCSPRHCTPPVPCILRNPSGFKSESELTVHETNEPVYDRRQPRCAPTPSASFLSGLLVGVGRVWDPISSMDSTIAIGDV